MPGGLLGDLTLRCEETARIKRPAAAFDVLNPSFIGLIERVGLWPI